MCYPELALLNPFRILWYGDRPEGAEYIRLVIVTTKTNGRYVFVVHELYCAGISSLISWGAGPEYEPRLLTQTDSCD